MARVDSPRVRVDSHLDADAPRSLAEDVLDGLTRPAKELAPKYFYDARGSELFDRITELPEYYPTRAERAILEAQADAIVAATCAGELVELGSGTAAKTRVLLDAMARAGTLRRYVPFDVDEQMVRDVAAALAAEYPGLEVHGVAGDFERHLDEIPPRAARLRPLVAFLGGTIGNFPPGSRRRFLRSIGERLDGDGYLLLGTDLVKDPRVLEAAYDDSAGVTAEFNRNVLLVAQPRARRRLRPRPLRPRRVLRPGARVDRDAAARPPRAHASASPPSTSTSRSPAARSCGRRSRPSSRPTASPPTSRPPASSWPAG